MGENDHLQPQSSGSDQTETLARLQEDAEEPAKPSANSETKKSEAPEIPTEKVIKLSGPLDPLAQKMRQILANDVALFVIAKDVASEIDKAQLEKVIEEKLDEFAQSKVPGYKQADDQKKAELRKQLYEANPLLQTDILAKAIREIVRKELSRGEFGQTSRCVYGAYIDQLNKEVTNAAQQLVHRKLSLPATQCPIKVPIDKNTKEPYSARHFRDAIASGEIESQLSNYRNANQNKAPDNEQREELTRAENFLKEAGAKLNPAELQAQVKNIGNQFKWLFEGNPPAGLMPVAELSDQQASDYRDRALPLLDLMIKINDHARALETLKQLDSGLVTPEFIETLRNGFPGTIETKDNQIKVKPKYPTTLEPSLDNSRKMAAIGNWLDGVHGLLVAAQKQYAFTADPQNVDKICFWGRVPEEGIDEATKQHYNYARSTYEAEKVKVTVMRLDGTSAKEERIKVSTCKQYEWSGLLTYKIGEPKVSGRATANGVLIPSESSGKAMTLTGGTQIRLSSDGIIQVKAVNDKSKTKVIDDKKISHDLKPSKSAADGWVDILPGYSLTSDGWPVKLENDVRYYKPDEPVALRTNGALAVPLSQAKYLPSEVAKSKFMEFMSETVPDLVDKGFLASGLFEGKILFSAGRKGAQYLARRGAAQAVETLMTREATLAALATTRKSAIKHGLIGGFGLVKEPIKTYGNALGNTIGVRNLGDKIEHTRSLIMAADIAATATKGWPLLGKAGERWQAVWGHADPELLKTYMGASTFLGKAKSINEKMLGLADVYFAPHAFVEAKQSTDSFIRTIDDTDKKEREAFIEVAERLQYHQWLPDKYKVAANLVKQLSDADRHYVDTQVRSLTENSSELAAIFLNDKTTQRNKLAAALGLLKANYREDGSIPDKLAMYKLPTGQEVPVARSYVETFLLNYNVLSFDKLPGSSLSANFEECMSKVVSTTTANPDIFEKGTKEVLNLPADNEKRIKHTNNLLDIFKNPTTKPNDKLAAGISLLYLGVDQKTGDVKQKLADKSGWEIKVDVRYLTEGPDHRYLQSLTEKVYRMSEEDAINEARKSALQKHQNKGDDFVANLSEDSDAVEPVTETATTSEVLDYIRDQLANAGQSPAMRLALMDLLNQTKQINPVQKGQICLEILKDPAVGDRDKVTALIDEKHDRFAQFLASYQTKKATPEEAEKAAKKAQETAEKIINDKNIDKNIRTLTVAALDIVSHTSNPDQQRQQLAALHSTWQKYQKDQNIDTAKQNNKITNFTDFYVDSLMAKVHAKESSRPEAFRAAMNLTALSEHAVVKLTDKQKESVFDTFLQAASLQDKQRKPPFINHTILNIAEEDRIMAFQAISRLSANFDQLNQEKQHPKVRQRILDILNLPNAGNNLRADNIGETILKTHAARHANRIFADASNTEREKLAKALSKNINEITIPSIKEKQNGELDAKKLALVQEGMQRLVQVAKADSSSANDQSPRAVAISLFKDLANTSSPTKVIDPHIKIYALQSLNALRPVDGMEKLCTQILEEEKNPAVREEAEGIQRLLGWKDPDSYETEYLLSKKALKDAGDNVQLREAEKYILEHFAGTVLNDDISKAKRDSDRIIQKEDLALFERNMKRLVGSSLENTDEGKKARSALAFIISTNGNPFADSIRAKAGHLAAQGWNSVCHSTDSEVRKSAAPLAAVLMTHAPTIAYADCYEVTEGLLALGPDTKDAVFTKKEIGTLLSMSLERELHRTINDINDPHFTESQDLHLYLLDKLKSYQTKEQIPLLVALADERHRSSLERDVLGMVVKVNYPDGRSAMLTRKGTDTIAFSLMEPNGQQHKWIKDSASKAFFSEDDLKEKKNPWYCKVNLLNNGNLIIQDAPNALAILPRESGAHSVETAGLDTSKVGLRSPGGTLTAQYGSKTIYTRDGAQVVEVNLGMPGKVDKWEQKLPNGMTAVSTARDNSYIWAQVTYPDGSKLSQHCDAMGRGIGLRVQNGTAINEDTNQRNLLGTPPPWTRRLGVAERPNLSSDGFNRDTYAFYRTDAPKQHIEKGQEIRYETRIETSGSIVTERLAERIDATDGSGNTITPIVRSTGWDDNSDHSMPLVRDFARNMLAQVSEDTHGLRAEVKTDTTKSDIEIATNHLKDIIDNRKANSEEVCKAIFAAGLAAPIREWGDPRRAIFNELLSNAHERVRLSAAHMLFEQSIYRQDKRAGALELANIADQGSLVGYRLDAQRTIERARQNIDHDRHKTDPTIRLALGLAVDENSFGVLSANDPARLPLKKLLTDERPAIRLLAASKLLHSSVAADQQDAAKIICTLARQADTTQIRDQALSIIYGKDVNDRVQEALGRKNETKQLLLATLESTKLAPLPEELTRPQSVKETDRSFNERYDAVKLAILNSRDTYLNGFDRNWVIKNPYYMLLDTETRNTRIKETAEKELGNWSMLGYKPNYATTYVKTHEMMYQQLRGLVADAGLSPAEEEQQQRPEAAEQARIIIAHLALTERGALGEAVVHAIAENTKDNSIAAEKMARIAHELICQPTLESHMRGLLFKALKERSLRTSSGADKAETAELAARALATEFLIMPKDINTPKYLNSENLLIDLLTYLKDVHYHGNSAAIKALHEAPPSEKVKKAAEELLNSSKDMALRNGGNLIDSPLRTAPDDESKKTKTEKQKTLPLPKLEIIGKA